MRLAISCEPMCGGSVNICGDKTATRANRANTGAAVRSPSRGFVHAAAEQTLPVYNAFVALASQQDGLPRESLSSALPLHRPHGGEAEPLYQQCCVWVEQGFFGIREFVC